MAITTRQGPGFAPPTAVSADLFLPTLRRVLPADAVTCDDMQGEVPLHIYIYMYVYIYAYTYAQRPPALHFSFACQIQH